MSNHRLLIVQIALLCYYYRSFMRLSYIAFFLAFSVALMPSAVLAADEPINTNRYLIQTNKSFWRTALGARNIFDDGFTANLSDLQLRVAKLAGLKPILVKRFNILTETDALPVAPTPQITPISPVSWGVRYVLRQDTTKTSGGKDIGIALVDTGVDAEHPDLKDRLKKCTNYADPNKPFIDQECEDTNGHGTHMAGIAVADGGKDGKGMFGLAPEADLLVYKACDANGLCYSDNIAKAMIGAVNDGAHIIMLGFGGESDSSFVRDAIEYAVENNVLVVSAAGNSGPDNEVLDWPARNSSVIAVGAIDSSSLAARFSSRGGNDDTKAYQVNYGDIELSAPGVNIESTFKGGGYAILSGTSMAVPHIAGLAARVWQSDDEQSAQATRLVLRNMARDIEPVGDDAATGWGVPVE